MRRVVIVEEGGGLRRDPEDHVSPVASVPTIRAPERLELLSLDRHAAVATVASRNVQHYAVDEARHAILLTPGSPPILKNKWSGPIGPLHPEKN
jgi:hypothetical protein